MGPVNDNTITDPNTCSRTTEFGTSYSIQAHPTTPSYYYAFYNVIW